MTIKALYPEILPALSLDFARVKALDPRITFARASSATYYGTRTVKAEENLLLRSQEFDNAGAWAPLNATVAANTVDTTAPDGTSTAEKLTDDATNGAHRIEQILSAIATNTDYAVSCFLKKGTSNFAYIAFTDASTSQRYFAADFNLDTGAVRVSGAGSSGTLISATITAQNDGWYRCSIVGQISATGAMRARIGVSDGTTEFNTVGVISYAGSGSTIYLWGAQLEQRSSVTAYTPTTTQPITNYIPVLETAASGVARFDHNPTTGESLGFLVEEQRTNLLVRSEEFDNAAWLKTDSSITANTIVAPDGTLTGDKIVENTANSGHSVGQNSAAGSTVNTNPYTISFYAKAGERNRIFVRMQEGATFSRQANVSFNLSTGVAAAVSLLNGATAGSASMTSVGNGWYRCVLTATLGGTDTRIFVPIGLEDASGNRTYTGDGYSGIYIWGAQLE
jgi:hypothetical protein